MDSNLIAGIINLMSDREEWTGTTTDLINALELSADTKPHAVSRRLNFIKHPLQEAGLLLDTSRDSKGNRIKTIRHAKSLQRDIYCPHCGRKIFEVAK